MKGIFFRNFIIYAIVILLSFSALGSTFAYQINQFALQEKMNMLTETADKATESTVSYLENSAIIADIAPAAATSACARSTATSRALSCSAQQSR